MATLPKRPYKGTRDLFPPEKRAMDYIFSIMKKTAKSFGYEAYDGPLLEDIELYRAKSGQELIAEQIYSFHDRGKRWVAIRPEMTPTLARMVAQIHRETPRPIRWFSLPNLYRYERPQKGRLREHWQFNVDVFGAPRSMGEVEILQMAVGLMKNFNADQSMFEILVNDRRIVNFVLNHLLELHGEKAQKLYKAIDKYKKVTPEAFTEMVDKIGLNNRQKDHLQFYLELNSFTDILEFLQQKNATEIRQNFLEFYQLVQGLGFHHYLRYDPCIVRGVDYYTGIVFEVFDKNPNNPRAICGGGAYANLLQIFNEPALPGVGFGLGDVTLQDFLATHNLLPDFSKNQIDLYLAAQVVEGTPKLMGLASQIRSHHFRVLTELGPVKFKKAWSNGEKNGAYFIGLLDERELSSNQIQIKNAKTKEATFIQLNEIQKIVNLLGLDEKDKK